jgi:hypothetical protein
VLAEEILEGGKDAFVVRHRKYGFSSTDSKGLSASEAWRQRSRRWHRTIHSRTVDAQRRQCEIDAQAFRLCTWTAVCEQ